MHEVLRESVSGLRVIASIEAVLRKDRFEEDAIRPEVAMIADAGERHVRYAKRGDCLNEWNHGRTEYHKGMASPAPASLRRGWPKLVAFVEKRTCAPKF